MKSTYIQLAIAFAVLALTLGGYLWWYQQVTSESSMTVSLLQEIKAKEELAKRTSTVEAAFAKLSTSQNDVQNYFISEKNIVSFLEEMEEMGEFHNARVRVVSVGAPSVKAGEQSIALSLTIEGGFDAVLRTLGLIEHAPYALVITSLTMNKVIAGWSASVGAVVGSAVSAPGAPAATAPASTKASVPPNVNGVTPL